MSFLIDTNVLSELRRKRPNVSVVAWLQHRPASQLHVSVLTLGELRKGIEAMPRGERRDSFRRWLDDEVPRYFAGRVLTVDGPVADRWGRLSATAGRPLPVIDSLLAATALTHGLSMVTRNSIDFGLPELRVIDPWQAPAD